MSKSLGIMGGCFDPIHLGHLIVAEEVRVKLKLDRILFVPTAYQPLKERHLSSPHHRLRMLELALADNEFFDLSRVEIDRPGPSYTVETLRLLQVQYPEAEFYFILGWDALNTFHRWKEPKEIIALAFLVAVPRYGSPQPLVEELERAVPGIASRLFLLEKPVIDISSAEIRRRVKEGLSIRYLVPPSVERYVQEQGLYK